MVARPVVRGRSRLLGFVLAAASVVALLALAGPASALATEAPIAAWSFDEGHGEVARDVYGSHDGSLEHSPSDSPPEWSNGRFGDALRFQGQGYQCVNVPQSPDLELQESFTLETWVRPEGSGVEEPLIFKEAPTFESHMAYMLYLGLESNGKVGGYVEEPGFVKPEVTSGKLPVGKWTHLALAFDSGEHKLRLYVDGEPVDSVDAEGPQPTEGPLKFGCSEIYGQDFEGRLDEVRIYDRALSAEEIGHDMTTALQTPAPSQEPVASYSFDEESSPGTDLSGGGRTATLEGATWTPHGRYGGAVQLDGEDSLSIPASPGLHVEEEFTVEAWVRPEGNTGKYSPLISKETEGTAEQPWFLYEGSWVANQPYGGLEGETPGETVSQAGEPIPQDRWTHLAFTFDGSRTRLYVDGELVDEDAGTEPVISEGRIELGADQSGNHFKGRIDEVRIYNRALNTGEVAADRGTPLQTPPSGPVAAWAFDEGTGETAVDTTGNGHTATIEGADWGRGRYGNGLAMDGEGDCATVTDVEGLQMDEEFTFETWLRYEGQGEEASPFLTMEDASPPPGQVEFSWAMLAGGEEVPKAWIRDGEELGFKGIYGTALLPTDAWAHVALTDDGATLRLYVDGELVRTAPAPDLTDASGPLRLGCGLGYHFEGRIDETRIYGRALNAGEVAADMETPIQTPKQAPVAEYSFDEAGESYEDASGDGHTATGEDVTWTSHGRYGGAVELDGEEGCLTIAASEELRFSEEFSLEAWVRPEGSEEEAHPVISQDDLTSPGEEEPFAYELLAGENEKPKAWVRKPGSGFQGVYGEEPLPERTWSHLALVDDGAHVRLYVDGRLVDEETSPPLATSEEGLKIGCGIVGGTFQGRIDEVRIYNRALNAGEVGADMEAPIQTPKAGPVAAYAFDEGEGTTVQDTTGNGHTATIEGATWARGRYGSGLEFAGSEDCVSIPATGDLQASEEFTLEAWVRPEGSGEEALPVIAMNDEKSGPGEEQFSYELFGGQDARPKGWVRKAHEEGTWGVEGEEPLPEKAWSHLTLTDDGHVIRLYVDGKLGNEEVSTDVAPPLTEAEGPLTIGCGIKYGAFRYFKGRIDEVRIYDRALDGAEVAFDTESPIQAPKWAPVAGYSFDEGEGSTVEDLTGDKHTATIHGAEWTTRGKYGGAMDFDASKESYLSVPDSPELDFSEEFTLEAWVRPASGSAEYEPLITEQTSGSKVQPYFLYEGSSEPDHTYGGTQANTVEESYAHATNPLPANTWTHVALTFAGTRAKLYVNGELVDDNYACPPVNGEGDLEIGGATEVASYFSGRIDEVRIYDRSLDQAEIAQTMTARFPTAETEGAEEEEETSAILLGSGDPNGAEAQYYFEYGLTENYGAVAMGEELGRSPGKVKVSEAAVKLQPETTYNFRFVTEGLGGVAYGKNMTFTTGKGTRSKEELEALAPYEEKFEVPEKLAKQTPADFYGLNWTGDLARMLEKVKGEDRFEAISNSGAQIFRVKMAPNQVYKSAEELSQREQEKIEGFEKQVEEAVKRAHQQGLEVVPYIGDGPIPKPGFVPRTQVLVFAREMVEKYGPGTEYGIKTWEVWNEPNRPFPLNLGETETPARFEREPEPEMTGIFVQEMAHALEEGAGAKKGLLEILGPGLYGYRVKGCTDGKIHCHEGVNAYLKKMDKNGTALSYDAVSIHPYVFKVGQKHIKPHVPGSLPGFANVDAETLREAVRTLLVNVKVAKKPIWITEIGFPTIAHPNSESYSSNEVNKPVTESMQKLLLRATFAMFENTREEFNLSHVIYYNVQDSGKDPPQAQKWEHHCGLLREGGGKRPAWAMFERFAKPPHF